MIVNTITMIAPLRVWLEGRSKKNIFLVKMGFLARADTSVYFYISTELPSDLHSEQKRNIGNL